MVTYRTTQNQMMSEIVSLLQPNSNGLILFSFEFIEQLIERFKPEGLAQIFEPIFEELLTLIRATSLLNNFLTYFNAFSLLIRHKALREMVSFLSLSLSLSLHKKNATTITRSRILIQPHTFTIYNTQLYLLFSGHYSSVILTILFL
jgi:hypothetical protein